jgi:hypothetical protein
MQNPLLKFFGSLKLAVGMVTGAVTNFPSRFYRIRLVP